ncbi:MAG TPA: sporulation protein YqfD [Candidatus Onthousia excrementipullorum]|uniref:Sporulation protein YqfD n=1 Tax=Candidatus Onthousia excrementipullorum TaxID=2840884 RepID=A0A9D1DVS2_9FIRM|nr:sporulation protein YqfD [Candidatus Onthousia excrementipullorum]
MSSYILKITGKRIDTFLMLLVRFSINFKMLKRGRDFIVIEVLEEDYDNLLKISTTYKIEIVKRKGLLNVVHFIKTRKLFVVIVLLGFLFFNLLTNIVFSIKVIDTDSELREIILTDLEELGLRKYNFKISYKEKEKMEEAILKKEKDILEWIEIEEKGVSYEVKLIRRVKDDIKKETEPRDIIAKKTGLITKIEAESGEVVTKKNAYVKKGDTLISGLIRNNGNIVSKVRAEGRVYAEIWYKVALSLPLTYHEEMKTGNNKNVLEISFLSDDIAITDFSKYKHSKDTKKILYKHPLLPISINLTKKEEVKTTDIDFSENYEENIKPLAVEKLKNKLGNDIKILSEKVLKREENTDRIDIEIFFKVEEDITSYKSLKDFNIEEENKKLEEESN